MFGKIYVRFCFRFGFGTNKILANVIMDFCSVFTNKTIDLNFKKKFQVLKF